MNIRKATPDDMSAVLGLIQELAAFENEPDAVLVTVADLIRDGFGPVPLFHVFVAEIKDGSSDSKQAMQIIHKRFIVLPISSASFRHSSS